MAKRYLKADDKYINGSSNNQYIIYLDTNNLYGWGMIQPLRQGGFKWVDNLNDLTIREILKKVLPDGREQAIFSQGNQGYILECNLEYPKELHDLHSDYPLAPEKLIVQNEWLSDYCQKLKENLN